MKNAFDIEALRQVILTVTEQIGILVADWSSKLLLALLIIAIGFLSARVVQAILGFVLRKVGVDRAVGSSRISEALGQVGVSTPVSLLTGRIAFWSVLLTFSLLALQSLGIRAVEKTLENVISFLPNLFAAVVIALLGIPLVRLVRNIVVSGAAAASIPQASHLGGVTQAIATLLVLVLALGQLGIQTEVLITVITALVATVGLSMGIAFALGAKPIVTHILAGHFLRQNIVPGTRIEVVGKSGEVQSIGAIATVIVENEREWNIPNEKILTEVSGRGVPAKALEE